jgi:DNA-binding CsgD family transcriptional regulator
MSEQLPAGFLPSDQSIEFFADPQAWGKLFFMSSGSVHSFTDLPLHVLEDLTDELLSDTRAIKGLLQMNITEECEMVQQYNFCNRGRLSHVPDISPSGTKHKQYHDCGRKGKCPGEGKVCSILSINGFQITNRELECLKLIGTGLTYKMICAAMGFRRQTAVNSLIDRLRDKLQCANQVEIALKVKEIGLI